MTCYSLRRSVASEVFIFNVRNVRVIAVKLETSWSAGRCIESTKEKRMYEKVLTIFNLRISIIQVGIVYLKRRGSHS